jgi:LacI family transcriptional regulator
MPITLEEIAKLAGVSRSTVSRVVNGNERVRDETRKKVQAVIDEVNFQPNIAARSLAAGRTGIIGLVIPAGVSALFKDPYFPQLIQGITAACNKNEHSMMLWVDEPTYHLRTIRQVLYSGLLDGVIISSMLIDDPIIKSLYQRKMPFVLIGRHPDLDVNYLDVDNKAGAFKATSFLIESGYDRIATITGPKNMIAGYDRYRGYCRALNEHGFIVDELLIAEGDFTEESGYRGMKKLLPHSPDAVFAANDSMAMGALRAIHEADLLVPKDVAVVGFDDAPVASHANPPLTTMRQSPYEMGYKAVNLLIDVIKHPSQPTKNVVLESELIIRESSQQVDVSKEVPAYI